MKVLDEAIQNNKNNYTKFIIVANKKIFESRANKISISFEVPHESGSLYHKLSHFIYNGINMNKIESRPVQGKAWEYRFFVDIEETSMMQPYRMRCGADRGDDPFENTWQLCECRRE